MPIDTATQRENLAVSYGANAPFASLHSADPGTTGANELAGGSPAYARKALTWAAGTVDGTVTATAVFDVESGDTVAGVGLWSAGVGGTYLDGATVTSQTFSAQGTYTVTLTFNQA